MTKRQLTIATILIAGTLSFAAICSPVPAGARASLPERTGDNPLPPDTVKKDVKAQPELEDDDVIPDSLLHPHRRDLAEADCGAGQSEGTRMGGNGLFSDLVVHEQPAEHRKGHHGQYREQVQPVGPQPALNVEIRGDKILCYGYQQQPKGL